MNLRLSHARSLASRVAALTLAAALGAFAPGASAQQANRDYYEPDASPADRQLRHNVELYHLEPGIADMRVRKWYGAKGHFEFILNYYPNHPVVLDLYSVLCDVRWVDIRCESAPRFERAIERNPKIAQTYVVYAIHLQRRKKLDEAIAAFNKALSMNPKLMNAHYNLGLAYVDKRDYELANRHAQLGYSLGATLPGLRDKIKAAGKWQPLAPEELQSALSAK